MPKQSSNKTPQKSSRAPKQRKTRHSRLVEFPQARGRMVEMVELSLDPDFPCISIRFQGNTDLTVVIDPWLTFRADYSRWKGGEQKVLKCWPIFTQRGHVTALFKPDGDSLPFHPSGFLRASVVKMSPHSILTTRSLTLGNFSNTAGS